MPSEIKLTKGFFAIVDDEDYERVNALKWHVYTERPLSALWKRGS